MSYLHFAERRAAARLVGLARAVSAIAADGGQPDLARYAEHAAADYLRGVEAVPDYDLAVHEREATLLLRAATRGAGCQDRAAGTGISS